MGAAGSGVRRGRRPLSRFWCCLLQVSLLSAASAFVDRGYWQRSEEVGLMDRIRERAIVAGADVLPDPSSRQQVPSAGKSSVTSAVPCDLFNRTEWSCWLVRPLNRTQRLVLRLSVADDELDRSRVRVEWRRKHKIRGQNLYAVEEITDGAGWPHGSTELFRDPLSLELNPLADRDRFLNKIQALVYVRRGAAGGDPAGLGEVLYGQLTYVIDSDPTVLSPTEGSREVALALEEHVALPPDGAIIEWKRRLSRVRFCAPPPSARLLAGGRLALVTALDAPLSLSCAVFARDGRFYAMRHFLVAFPAGIRAPSASDRTLKSDLAESTTEGDTVIHLSVKVGSQPVPGVGSGEPADDYALVQTNVSVINGQPARDDPAEASRGDGAVPAAGLQNSRENPKPYARAEPPPAVFANNVCFRVVRGENGAASVVPCDSLTSTTPRPASETRDQEPHSRWRHHRHRGGGADVVGRGRQGHRSRFGSKRRLASATEEERLRADLDGLQPCRSDEECSRHASCVLPLGSAKGRCACDRGYLGNGLFCWEGFYLR